MKAYTIECYEFNESSITSIEPSARPKLMQKQSNRSSVAEHLQFKPEMSWVRLLAAAGLFSLSSIFAS